MADPRNTVRRGPSRTDMDAGDAIRETRMIARRTQEGDRKASLLAALQQQQAQAIAAGVPKTALPALHGQMSEADFTRAQASISKLMQTRGAAPVGGTGSRAANAMIATGLPGGTTAAGQVIRDPDAAPAWQAPQQRQAQAAQQPANTGRDPQAVAQASARGAATFPLNPSAMAALEAWTPVQEAMNAPETGNSVTATESRSPALEQMVRDGTLPADAKLNRTGAGFSTEVQSESGPRSVAFQPTMDQALAADFGGRAREEYGKEWGDLTPEQRAATIRSRGVNKEMVQGSAELAQMDPRAFKGFRNEYGSGFATVAPPAVPTPANQGDTELGPTNVRQTGEQMGPTNVRAGEEVMGPELPGPINRDMTQAPQQQGGGSPLDTLVRAGSSLGGPFGNAVRAGFSLVGGTKGLGEMARKVDDATGISSEIAATGRDLKRIATAPEEQMPGMMMQSLGDRFSNTRKRGADLLANTAQAGVEFTADRRADIAAGIKPRTDFARGVAKTMGGDQVAGAVERVGGAVAAAMPLSVPAPVKMPVFTPGPKTRAKLGKDPVALEEEDPRMMGGL